MEKFFAAAIQINSQDNVSKNLETIDSLVKSATADGARLVVLPEYSNYLSDDNQFEHAETLSGPTITAYAAMARQYKVFFHCGSFLEASDEPQRAFNTSVLMGPDGGIIEIYRKIHLFDIDIDGRVKSLESAHLKPGSQSVAADTDLGIIGLTICYDLRFPELFRHVTNKGAKLITTPAAFTLYTGKDHWEVLLRARAIENQVYVVAPGQWGEHPNSNACFGSSMIIDPWGTVLARAPEGVGYIIAPIDYSHLTRIRQQIPSLRNRRDFD